MKLLIALYHPFSLWTAPAWLGERLRSEFPHLTVTQLPGPRYEGIEREIEEADVCIAWSIRPEQFAHAKRLKWVHSPAAAVHQLMFPEMVSSSVVLTNARDVHGPVVAEHVIAVVCALAKKLPAAIRFQDERQWAQQAMFEQRPAIVELAGAHLLMFGMGSIGREVCRRAKGLDMRVTAVRERPERGPEGADAVVGLAELKRVLPEIDFVVLAAPLTPSTQKIAGREFIATLKPSAYLVNVGRGPLIDDEALIAALQSGGLAGAALDVFVEEPLPASSPYWSLPNVIVTPHTAAVTNKLWERHYQQISQNLRRFLGGEPLIGEVNKQRGY